MSQNNDDDEEERYRRRYGSVLGGWLRARLWIGYFSGLILFCVAWFGCTVTLLFGRPVQSGSLFSCYLIGGMLWLFAGFMPRRWGTETKQVLGWMMIGLSALVVWYMASHLSLLGRTSLG